MHLRRHEGMKLELGKARQNYERWLTTSTSLHNSMTSCRHSTPGRGASRHPGTRRPHPLGCTKHWVPTQALTSKRVLSKALDRQYSAILPKCFYGRWHPPVPKLRAARQQPELLSVRGGVVSFHESRLHRLMRDLVRFHERTAAIRFRARLSSKA